MPMGGQRVELTPAGLVDYDFFLGSQPRSSTR
jgi:hypothetical protein